MALLERYEPSARDLHWFGLLLAAFAALLGAVVAFLSGALVAAGWIWVLGACVALLYYAVPALRYSIFRLWMALAFPIGWLVSHAMVAIVFFLIVTPLALVMRLGKRDEMGLALDRKAASHWHALPPRVQNKRYFQQF